MSVPITRDLPWAKDGRVLVTGAGGFIGSHLVDRLTASGIALTSLHHVDGLQKGEAGVMYADLCDTRAVLGATEGATTVFHLGAMVSAAAAQASPHEAFRVNTLGTQNVLEAARLCGVTRVVLLSTAHVFGRPSRLPVTEDHPMKPASVYAATKLAADVIALGYFRSFGLPVTVLRPFNIYGPRQGPVAVIPEIIAQAIDGRRIRMRDLRPQRDFVYVDDVIEALIKAAAAPGAAGQEILLASGQAVSVASLVRRIALLTSCGAAQEPESDDTSDVIYGSASRARTLLEWEPQTSLDEGLARTISWWRSHPSGAAGSIDQ